MTDFGDIADRLAGSAGLPGDETYDAARRVWYPPARTRAPLAALQPASTEDVAQIVAWARREGVRLSPRSGGHSFDGFPVQPGTVLVDFSQMNAMHLRSDGVLTVEPGARAQMIAQALSPANRALPTGDCGTVALGGLLSGGGFGYSTRNLGLTIDSLLGATVVTGQGEVLEVSEDQHADLFWACRGGGGAAGLVTEFRIRSFSVDQVIAISLVFNAENAAEALLRFDTILRKAPRTFDLKFKMRSTGPERFLDALSSGPVGCVPGTPIVEISGQYLGQKAEAEALLKPLLECPGLSEATLRAEPYFEAMLDLIPLPTLNDPAPATARPLRVASDLVKDRLNPATARAITDFVTEAQTSPDLWGGCIVLEPCDGTVSDMDVAATAFAHRSCKYLLQWEMIQADMETPQDVATLDDFLTRTRKSIAPLLTGGRYLNYADRLDTPKSWWGENLDRLSAVSRRHDPERRILSRLHPA